MTDREPSSKTATMSETELFDLVARELLRVPNLALTLRAISALELAGLVQLALRHPNIPPQARDAGARILEGISAYFRASHATGVLELLRRGDDPNQTRGGEQFDG
jgi:hypothetical protein